MKSELFFTRRIFAGIPQAYAELESSRIVVLRVPYDSTSDPTGSRAGAQAIMDASQYLELYDQELNREIYKVGIHTLPELQPALGSPEEMIGRVAEVIAEILNQGKLPVMLGGEHSLTLGAVKACLQRFPQLSVLHLDAHGDLRDSYLGTRFSHASVMRRIWELCPVTQVGVRSLSLEERDFLATQERQPFWAEGRPWDGELLDRIVSTLSQDIYITIDLDVFDPSVMAAVGNPEPGGLGWYPVLALLRQVATQRQIVGFDIVELSPREGPMACAFLAARLTYKLIGYATCLRSPS